MNGKSEGWRPNRDMHPRPDSTAMNWKDLLIVGKRGRVLAVVANAIIAFRFAPEWQGVLHFNDSSMATVAKVVPPFGNTTEVPFEWADEHDILAAAWLQSEGITVNRDITGQAVQVVAKEHCFHPIRNYLDPLSWDQIQRIDDWLTLYLGADPSDYVRAVAAKFLIGAVARVYRPGVKNDTCLILEGPQGAMKSTALRALASDEFFTDDIDDLGSKDSAMQTGGVWIIEISELDAMTRADVSRIKAFMSRQVDRFRPPYGRRVIKAPRQCVFAGTVNRETYLKDETGGRRFWPVKCGVINLRELTRDRDQLWAEARERFNAGDSWWLSEKDLVESAAQESQARYEVDPWDSIIAEWVQDPKQHPGGLGYIPPALHATSDSVSVEEILIHCVGKRPELWTQVDQNRVARCLRSLGWGRYQVRTLDVREWRYRRSPVSSPVEKIVVTE